MSFGNAHCERSLRLQQRRPSEDRRETRAAKSPTRQTTGQGLVVLAQLPRRCRFAYSRTAAFCRPFFWEIPMRERGFVGVREENRNERFYSSLRNIIHSICCVVFVSILFWSWMKDATVCWQKQCDAMPNVVFRGFKHTNDGISRRRFCVTFMCVFK